jgi:MATE family multidrug resistance protein
MADVKIPTLITLVAYWVIGLPTGYVLAFAANWGAHGVWVGLLTGLSVAAIMLSIRFNLVSKRIIK